MTMTLAAEPVAVHPDYAATVALIERAIDEDDSWAAVDAAIEQERAHIMYLTRKRAPWSDYCEAMSFAIGDDESGERRYSAADVAKWAADVVEAGCIGPRMGRVRALAVHSRTIVPNAPLREHFLAMRQAGEITAKSLARAAGVTGDSQVDRLLGLKNQSDARRNRPCRSLFMSYDMATKLARGMGMTPTQAGI